VAAQPRHPELGIERVLTSGQASTADAGIPLLAKLVQRAGSALAVLAGRGLRERNARRIVEETGVTELHLRAGPGGQWIRAVVRSLTAPASA